MRRSMCSLPKAKFRVMVQSIAEPHVPSGDSQEERTCALCPRVKVTECGRTPELPAPSQRGSRKSIFCAVCEGSPEPLHRMSPCTLEREKVTRTGVDYRSGRKEDTAVTRQTTQ